MPSTHQAEKRKRRRSAKRRLTDSVRILPEQPQWLRAELAPRVVAGVDKDAKVIRGVVIAEAGDFKDGRGRFDATSLKKIVELSTEHARGLKARFTHPTLSDDGLGKFLGRQRELRLDDDTNPTKVVADLHLDPTSFDTPNGNLGGYVMNLAGSDDHALATSLVLNTEQIHDLDKDGNRTNERPPLWMPTRLHASDVVDTGAATSSFLSVEGLPDEAVRKGSELLNQVFAGQPRNVIRSRVNGWLDKYMELKFGQEDESMSEKTKQDVPAVDTKEDETLATENQVTPTQPTEDAAKLARDQERERTKQILELCDLAGCPHRSREFIEDESLGIDAIRKALLAHVAEERKLADHMPGKNDGEENDPKDKLRAQYREHTDVYEQLGVTEELFLKEYAGASL